MKPEIISSLMKIEESFQKSSGRSGTPSMLTNLNTCDKSFDSFRWCEYCSYHTIQKSNLRQHVRNLHSSPTSGRNQVQRNLPFIPAFYGPSYTNAIPAPAGKTYSQIPTPVPAPPYRPYANICDYRMHTEDMCSSLRSRSPLGSLM